MAILIWSACAPAARPTPLSFSGSWSGTTSQNQAITFTVSPDLAITAVTVGYGFGGCVGSVSVVTNVPLLNTGGTASAVITNTPNGPTGSSRTVINFLFPSVSTANGTVQFSDLSGCGSSNATWTATRR